MKIVKVKKIIWLITLAGCVLLFSAFRFEGQKNLLSRMDLALLIERVLENCRIDAQAEVLPSFGDISEEQIHGISRTLSLKIMAGFPDGNFRPAELLRNLETVNYLQKLVRFLKNSSSGPLNCFSQLPVELAEAGGFISKDIMTDLVVASLERQAGQRYTLSGKVINAVTGKPVSEAYIAGEKVATVTDENGNFSLDFAGISGPKVVLFAAAEDFQPVEIKKDLCLSSIITFRLRPEKKQFRQDHPLKASSNRSLLF